MDYSNPARAEVHALVALCKSAHEAGASPEQIRMAVLPEAIHDVLRRLDAGAFLNWIREDREYAYFYYDAQQSGVCAKPREAAALILEQLAMAAIE